MQIADQLSARVKKLTLTDRFTEAIPLAQEVVAITEQVRGGWHRDTAVSLNELAVLYYQTGAYAQAEPLYQRVLAIVEKVIGPEQEETATALNNLAVLYWKQRAYLKAEPIFKRTLAIWEKLVGPKHPNTATSLDNLANLYLATGAYAKAEELFMRALTVQEQLGQEGADTATALNNLGLLYSTTGAYAQAESLYQRALAIREKTEGPDRLATATSLNNLAMLYSKTGAYAKAEPLLERALTIREKQLGREHPDVATSLNNLGLLYSDSGAYVQAELQYQRALTIRERLGREHPDMATSLNNLAELYGSTGAYAQAKPLHQWALAIREKKLGREHPETAQSLNNLGLLYSTTGAYAQAEPLYQRALAIRKAVLGPQHPATATSISNLATLAWAQGSLADALQHLREAAEIEETNMRSLLVHGDEARKRAYTATLVGSTYGFETFAVVAAAKIPEAISFGLDVVLQRKGRVLDVLAESLSRIRTSAIPEDQALWTRYVAAQTDWATLSMRGPGLLPVDQYGARLAELEQKVQAVATELSARSSQFRTILEPVTLDRVQQALPPHAVLLEWVRYRPFNPKAIQQEPHWGDPRYALYILKPKGMPVLLDLGGAEALEGQVTKLLTAVRRPGGMQETQGLARDLYRRLIQRVQGHLGSAHQLLLSPDGQLNLLPFGVLQDTKGRYLGDQYEVTYLTSGRDLLRPVSPAEASRPSLLVADPAFDSSTPSTRTTTTLASTRRSADVDRSDLRFDRLKGTAKEAEDLGPLLKLVPSQVLTLARATEAAVKQAQSPRILHIATHGFFLSDVPKTPPTRSRGAVLDFLEQQQPTWQGENPLLQSGLALAGANQRQSGTDDGLLTALEVSSLNLTGTQLAVLSACETGVGQVQNGEGVYGLRRALVLAGVRTQVVSLWKVDDAATQAFMGHYYRYVLNGMGRSAALRTTQQKMRESLAWTHPYYWAAFVVIGDATPLSSASVTTTTTRTR